MCTVPRVLERLYQKQQLELAKGSEVEQHRSQWAAEAGWSDSAVTTVCPLNLPPREALDETVLPVLDEDVGRKVRGLFWRTHESDSLRRSKSESVSSSLFLCDGGAAPSGLWTDGNKSHRLLDACRNEPSRLCGATCCPNAGSPR